MRGQDPGADSGARLQNGLRSLFRRETWQLWRNEQIVLAVLALLIGGAAACGAIGFREAIDLVQQGALGIAGESVASLAAQQPWWRVLLAPAAGGLAIGLYIRYVMRERRPLAVADVIEAAALQGGRMRFRAGISAALVSAASIGVGASVGREGPVVHLGATLGGWLATRLGLGAPLARTLLGCGVASAVAASFNAPIAGVFFALEVVIGHYALRAFAPIVIAAVTGTILSRIYFGDYPAFVVPEHHIRSFLEFPAFALLGVVSAATAVIFMWSIQFVQDNAHQVPVPEALRPACAGLAIGAVALLLPEVLGVGYETTDLALRGTVALWLLLVLIVAKTAATALCLGAGFGGGVFSPSLFLGALVGSAFGIVATSAFPELSSGHGAYAMIGMGAVAGSVLGAPISTILMIFELTGDYALTIGVMIATVIASVITQHVYGHSFFTWQLDRRGIDLSGGREMTLLRAASVDRLLRSEPETVTVATPLREIRQRLRAADLGELFVVDEEGQLYGTITLSDLDETAFDTSLNQLIIAADVARRAPPVLARDDDVETAVKLFTRIAEPCVAVVDSRADMRLVGCVWEHDVMVFFNRTLAEARREERGER
jgi:CIC family chloride channel protein